MSAQSQGAVSGAAQAAGATLMCAALGTPPGQAATAATVAAAVAAAPVLAVVALTAGVVYVTAKVAEAAGF
jgi:hypothetical protein